MAGRLIELDFADLEGPPQAFGKDIAMRWSWAGAGRLVVSQVASPTGRHHNSRRISAGSSILAGPLSLCCGFSSNDHRQGWLPPVFECDPGLSVLDQCFFLLRNYMNSCERTEKLLQLIIRVAILENVRLPAVSFHQRGNPSIHPEEWRPQGECQWKIIVCPVSSPSPS